MSDSIDVSRLEEHYESPLTRLAEPELRAWLALGGGRWLALRESESDRAS